MNGPGVVAEACQEEAETADTHAGREVEIGGVEVRLLINILSNERGGIHEDDGDDDEEQSTREAEAFEIRYGEGQGGQEHYDEADDLGGAQAFVDDEVGEERDGGRRQAEERHDYRGGVGLQPAEIKEIVGQCEEA